MKHRGKDLDHKHVLGGQAAPLTVEFFKKDQTELTNYRLLTNTKWTSYSRGRFFLTEILSTLHKEYTIGTTQSRQFIIHNHQMGNAAAIQFSGLNNQTNQGEYLQHTEGG